MSTSILDSLRVQIREANNKSEHEVLSLIEQNSSLSLEKRLAIQKRSVSLIEDIRRDDRPALLDLFLSEYGLSTSEGVALMCLAEALMRIPDAATVDALIEDKIADSCWNVHLGASESALVNASTWGLLLTGKVLKGHDGSKLSSILRKLVKRLGVPVIRSAVKRAMKVLGSQFVLGETIESALKRGTPLAAKGYTYSYDMLGEAALTSKDASTFFSAYKNAISALAHSSDKGSVVKNPGISIKLSALHPRYEVGQKQRVMTELVDRCLELSLMAKEANMGLNIDAEEMDRLDLSLDVIEAVLSNERLAGWDGFGVVVQAYSKRAHLVLDWLYALAQRLDRRIMVRLVKGAYWDTEIKRAQVEGLKGFPVFTNKSSTDCSYLFCSEKLLAMGDRIYPQFATHNANTVATILELADPDAQFEFQRLHGMGEVLHRLVREREHARCRIYAPVGPHRDLLAYLVRRLLENGANSSFVNQITNLSVPAAEIAGDPFAVSAADRSRKSLVAAPIGLFGHRKNSKGWDLHDQLDLEEIESACSPFKEHYWKAVPLLVDQPTGVQRIKITNPANALDVVGEVTYANAKDVEIAIEAAKPWTADNAQRRSEVLRQAADLYEANFGELFAVLIREAGKTMADAIAELREAVDFLRFYADQGEELRGCEPRGVITCISPWNFPLAIFTGQIAAALSVGNAVLAKPAETTSLCASIATALLHEAGVPESALQLLPGEGSVIGAALSSDQHINGVCFTGSTMTARQIHRAMAKNLPVDAPLIAETGGLNAMVVDSTALPEQAIKDIIASAFQSAGQRCSALRILYIQKDIATAFLEMLFGAMDEQVIGDPWDLKTDVGPVIDQLAENKIRDYVETAQEEGRLLKQLAAPKEGRFLGPAVISVRSISEMKEEIFGPVLHIATYEAAELDRVLDDINGTGFGLTFGLHTRIDGRVEEITSRMNVGNMYVNRNQIGAIVGSQPFGGEGLSGTGPKAGGPHYVRRFVQSDRELHATAKSEPLNRETVQGAIDKLGVIQRKKLSTQVMSGPTGESNVLSTYSRKLVLCLGPTLEAAMLQSQIAKNCGCQTLMIVPGAQGADAVDGFLRRQDLTFLTGFEAVVSWGDDSDSREIRQALAQRDGEIIPLIVERDVASRCQIERHLCIDTTAAGGNADLLAATSWSA